MPMRLVTVLNKAASRDSNPPKPLCDRFATMDGQWQSFPMVPNLVQSVGTGTYFGRVKIEGKTFRESLETDVFTKAKLRLPDFIKAKQKQFTRLVVGTFAEARGFYEADLTADHTLKASGKLYRRKCIQSLLISWPKLDALAMKTYGHLRRGHSAAMAQKVTFSFSNR